MGFGDFWLQSNNNKGKKFSLKDLQTLKPENIAKNPKLQKLITLFDSDGSGNLETVNSKGENELESIFSEFSGVAGDNQILEESEVSGYLKENNLENDVSVTDVFDFLGKFIKSNTDEDIKQADNEAISEFIRELEAYIQNRASQHTMTDAEFNKIKKEAYNTVLTSTISTEKTEKDYDDLFTFAKEKLSESGKTQTLEELTLYAAELQMLNPDVKADKKIKKGTSINIPAKSIDKKNIEILESKGIKVEKNNYIFFQKLLELDDTKQAVVFNAIKNSKFKTKEEVINEVYNKTKINLASTGLTIKVGSVSSTLENFITNTLKVDLSSKEGLKIYDRLSRLNQTALDSLPKEFIAKLSKMNNITFNKFADKAEVFGIILRTDEEMKEREKNSQAYRDLKARMFMAQYVADNYTSAVTISQSADRNLNFTQGAWWIRNARPNGYTTTQEETKVNTKVEQIKNLLQDVDILSNEEFSEKMSTIMKNKRTNTITHLSSGGNAPVYEAYEAKDASFNFDPKLAYTFMKQMQRAELAARVAKRLEPQRKQHVERNPYVQQSDNTRVYNAQREVMGIEYTVQPLDKNELEQLKKYIKSIKTRKELFLFAKSLHYKVDVISNRVKTMIPKENQAEIAKLLEQKAKELGFAEPTRPNSISLDTFRNVFTKPINKKVNYPKTNEKTIMETYKATKIKLLGNWDPVGEQIRTQEMEGTVGGVLDIATMILVTKGMGSMGTFVRIGNVGRNIGTATNVFKTANVASRFTKNAALINRLAKADKVLGGLWVNGAAGALHGAATMGAYGGLQGTVGMADNTVKNLLEGKEWSEGLGERFEQTLVMGYENAKFGLFAGYSGVLAQALGKGSVALGSKGIDKLFKTKYSKTVLDKVSSVVTTEGISGSEFFTKMQAASKAEGLVGFGYETGFFTLYHKMEEAGVDFNNEESLLTYIQNNLDEETKQSLASTYLSEGGNLAMFKIIGSLIQWVHIGKLSSTAAMEIQAKNNRALRNMNMRKVVENGKESYLVKFNENDKPIKVAPEQLMQLCEHKMFCADAEDKTQKDGSFKLPNNQTIEYDKAKKVYRTVIDAENTIESTSVEDLLVKINQTTFRNQINEQIFKDGQPATVKSLLKLVMTQNGEPIKINGVEIKPEEVLENSEALNNVKIERTKVNGKEVYTITLADGKTIQETTLEGLMNTCESFFQLELMKSVLEGVNEGSKPDKKTNVVSENSAKETVTSEETKPQNPATTSSSSEIQTFAEISNDFAQKHKSYDLYSDNDGNNVVMIVAVAGERPNPRAGIPFTYEVYRFDKDGNQISEPLKGLSEKEAKKYQLENKQFIDNRVSDNSGTLNSFIIPLPKIIRDALFKENGNSRKVDAKSQPIVEPSSNNGFGLEVQKATGFFAKDKIFFNGQKVATTKKELKQQLKDAGVSDFDIKSLFKYVIKDRKDKHVIERLSIIFRDQKYRINDKAEKYLDLAKTEEDAAILNMLITIDVDRLEQSFALIKERPYLYDFLSEGADIIEQQSGRNGARDLYIIENIMPGIKTEHQAQAALTVLKKIGNYDTASLRNFIRDTVNVCVKTESDIPKFAEFVRKYKDGTNNHYIDITQDKETLLKYWELLSDLKTGITSSALGELCNNPEVVDYAIQLKNIGIRNELFQYLVSKGTKINLNELLADKPDMYTVLQRVAQVDRSINETLKLLNRLTQNLDGSRNQDALNLGLKLIDFDPNAIYTGNNNSLELLYAPGWSHFHNILSMCKNADGSFNAKKINLVNSLIDNGFLDYRLHHKSVMDDVKAILDKYSDDFDYDGFINKFIQYGIPKKTIASLLMRDLSTAKGIIETIETLYESKNYSNDNIMLAINRMLNSKEDNSTILTEQLRDPELQVWFNRKDETKRQGLSYENLSNELIEELSSKDITQEKLQKIKEKFIILGSFRDSSTADWKKYEELIQNIYGIQDPKQLIEGLKSFNYFGTNPDMITHFILKGNFDTYKEVFEFLNSKYIEEGTGRKIALDCNKESVRDIMDAFALLEDEYNITRYQDRNNKPKLPQKVWDNLTEGSQENFKAIIELCRMFKGDSRITQDFKTELLSVSPKNLDLIKELYTRFKNSSINIEDFQNFVKLSTDYQKSNIQDLIINMLKEGKTYSEISMEVFKTSVDKALNTPLPESYNPENAYALDSRNSQRKLEIASDKSSMQLVPLETAKKPYKLLNLPSNKELIAALDRGEPVVIDIPDEGGMKPVKGNTSIAQDDIQSLGVVESAEVDLVYAVKRNWSNRKIARDIYQNSHDGHGRTLEGVQLSIKKVDGKYKVRLSGKSTYSYDFLKYMGATIKNMATDSAGKYGEGTKIVAASLLAKESTDYVRYASGDWSFEFNRSSDDVKTAEMTRKLTKNETPIDGNYIEFTTSDADLVESMLEAKDYFEHPYNKDFQNADFENEFFAIKILPPEEQGNIYMVQRYESYGNFENSLDGFTLVFKVKSEDVALSSKSKDAWVLPSDRDRSGLSYDDIKNMFNKYAKTMSDEDLVKLIATMEPLWNDSSRPSYLGRDIVETLAKIAEDRNLKIDFSSHHYVYASDALDKEFAKNMGYTPISIKAFTKIGLDDLSGASKAKTALKLTEVQEAKIKLLNEGARLIAQTLNPSDPTKMISEEADAPKFVFNEGGLKGEGGEAIIDSWAKIYKGHWIKSTMLDMNGANCRFADVLAIWLHEMTHKYGGDNSVEFTVAIKNLENHIIKVLVDNPDALAKFKYLAEKYDEVGGSSFIERTVDTDFSVESYRKEIHDEVSSLKEYKEYSEYVSSRTLQAPTRPVPEYKKLEPDMSKTYPEPLPTAEELSKQLKETGRVELSVPDLGGMKPTEDPAIIHEEDIPILGKAQKTTNTILYGQQLGWSPFKVARDIIQNFYDGNGHTMEGVTIKIERDGNKYKVRIEGKSKYDYNYLKNTGRGTKGYLVYDIGGFGEGAKVTALSLLAQGSNNVRYGSGSWTTDFHTTKTRIDTQEVDIMARTLSKADKDFDGSFMEFETSDTELVEQLLASKDFFVQPFNPGTQNLTYENKYFGFKFEENIPEKIILGQQFDISNDLKSGSYNSKPRLQLVFKLLPNNPEVMSFDNGKELKLTSTGVDRGNLDVSDAYKLCDRYVKTMSDSDIMQTLATLEKYWISENPYYTEYNRDNSLEMVFLTSIANEARSRWGSTDIFHNQKLVYINATSAEAREKAQWLKENGYRFVRQDFRYFVLDGEKEYNKQHSLHSIEPTQAEAQKLEIIRKAVLEIGQWNTSGLRLDISNTPIYVYDSEITNNPSIHARIVNGTCTGIFIDKKVLETQDFTSTIQEVMAQVLHYSGVDETSTYSYELTDLMRVEFSKFITDPNIVQKVHTLRNLYNNAGK